LNGNNKRTKDKESKRTFSPPTPEQVCAYGASIDFPLDGNQFVDFYQTRGWMAGKNKMADWRAAVRTWKNREQGQQPKIKAETREFTLEELEALEDGN